MSTKDFHAAINAVLSSPDEELEPGKNQIANQDSNNNNDKENFNSQLNPNTHTNTNTNMFNSRKLFSPTQKINKSKASPHVQENQNQNQEQNDNNQTQPTLNENEHQHQHEYEHQPEHGSIISLTEIEDESNKVMPSFNQRKRASLPNITNPNLHLTGLTHNHNNNIISLTPKSGTTSRLSLSNINLPPHHRKNKLSQSSSPFPQGYNNNYNSYNLNDSHSPLPYASPRFSSGSISEYGQAITKGTFNFNSSSLEPLSSGPLGPGPGPGPGTGYLSPFPYSPRSVNSGNTEIIHVAPHNGKLSFSRTTTPLASPSHRAVVDAIALAQMSGELMNNSITVNAPAIKVTSNSSGPVDGALPLNNSSNHYKPDDELFSSKKKNKNDVIPIVNNPKDINNNNEDSNPDSVNFINNQVIGIDHDELNKPKTTSSNIAIPIKQPSLFEKEIIEENLGLNDEQAQLPESETLLSRDHVKLLGVLSSPESNFFAPSASILITEYEINRLLHLANNQTNEAIRLLQRLRTNTPPDQYFLSFNEILVQIKNLIAHEATERIIAALTYPACSIFSECYMAIEIDEIDIMKLFKIVNGHKNVDSLIQIIKQMDEAKQKFNNMTEFIQAVNRYFKSESNLSSLSSSDKRSRTESKSKSAKGATGGIVTDSGPSSGSNRYNNDGNASNHDSANLSRTDSSNSLNNNQNEPSVVTNRINVNPKSNSGLVGKGTLSLQNHLQQQPSQSPLESHSNSNSNSSSPSRSKSSSTHLTNDNNNKSNEFNDLVTRRLSQLTSPDDSNVVNREKLNTKGIRPSSLEKGSSTVYTIPTNETHADLASPPILSTNPPNSPNPLSQQQAKPAKKKSFLSKLFSRKKKVDCEDQPKTMAQLVTQKQLEQQEEPRFEYSYQPQAVDEFLVNDPNSPDPSSTPAHSRKLNENTQQFPRGVHSHTRGLSLDSNFLYSDSKDNNNRALDKPNSGLGLVKGIDTRPKGLVQGSIETSRSNSISYSSQASPLQQNNFIDPGPGPGSISTKLNSPKSPFASLFSKFKKK